MLNTLPNNAKVFIFQADRKLTSSDLEVISTEMDLFIPKWATHGEELTAEYTVQNDFFLIIGNDEAKVATSGCSKDSLTHVIQSIGEKLKIDFFNRLNIAYQTSSGDFELTNMLNFKKMMQKDEIKQNTLVFNNLIEFKSDLLENWKIEVKNSWHKTLAPIL
jgi:hypothetical protein